jgi:uncharacterized protein YjiS (DUF1127 family)
MDPKMQRPTNEPLRAFAAWCARVLARRRARHQALQMADMSEHELLDLGIGRSEVPALLRSASAAHAASARRQAG